MKPFKPTTAPIPFIRELCKYKTEAEISEAEDNFRKYLLLVKHICERLEREENNLSELDNNIRY